MPSLEFFRHLGLFVCRNFFDTPLCEWLAAEIAGSIGEKARITGRGGEEFIDESQRRVLSAVNVKRSASHLVKARLRELKPALERHFQIPLAGCQGPMFLSYEKGGFYTAHSDASLGAPAGIQARRVSVVIFLNQASEEPDGNCYGGGGLKFYGLLGGEQWERCAFTLDPEPGLLIAFPSATFHEVRPVTHGRRFTIVAWFVADRANAAHAIAAGAASSD